MVGTIITLFSAPPRGGFGGVGRLSNTGGLIPGWVAGVAVRGRVGDSLEFRAGAGWEAAAGGLGFRGKSVASWEL